MTNAPLLIFPKFDREFYLETDASILGLGAILAQKNEADLLAPIAFASRSLQKHEKNYCSTELEALAVVWAVRHFRPYLYGHTCHLFTDHMALKSLLNTPHPSGKLARWGLTIQELDLHIHYRPGKTNKAADALSRNPCQALHNSTMLHTNQVVPLTEDGEGMVNQVCGEKDVPVTTDQSVPAPKDGEELICQLPQENSLPRGIANCVTPEDKITSVAPLVNSEDGKEDVATSSPEPLAEYQDVDPELKQWKDYLLSGKLPEDEKKARELVLGKSQFEVKDGVLYHVEKDKMLRVIPPSTSRKDLFDDVHNGVFGAHLRSAKIHSQLAQHYWWPSMRANIDNWVRACMVCASRHIGKPLHPPLTPLPVGGPFDRVGVDVVQLPTSRKGNKYAIVFVDYLTKWPEVFPARDQSSLTIAKVLVERIIPTHGVPSQLLSDRGAAFLSKLMYELYNLLGIKKISTTAYHPQTDGLVERFNRTLIDMLSKRVHPLGKDWDTQLPYVLFAYRSSCQESTKASPFSLLYGRNPVLPTASVLQPPVERDNVDLVNYQAEVSTRLSSAWESARTAINRAQKKQKHYHDRQAKDPKVSVGEHVFVYFPAKRSGKMYKFARPFQGPYFVQEVFDNGVQLKKVGHPRAKSLRVALNRVRKCPKELVGGGNSDGTVSESPVATPEQIDDQESNYSTEGLEYEDLSEDQGSETLLSPDVEDNLEQESEDPPDQDIVWSGRLRNRQRVEPQS